MSAAEHMGNATNGRTIYVAGGSDERAACHVDIERLTEAGWIVTHDWTLDSGYPENGGHSDPLRSATLDYNAVMSADYFWLRMPEHKSEGASFELGVAVCMRNMRSVQRNGPPPGAIIASGPWARSIFARLAGLTFDTHEQALKWLLEIAPWCK